MKIQLNAYEMNEFMSLVRMQRPAVDAVFTPNPQHNPIAYDWFLEQLDDQTAREMNCNACRKWWNRYAAAVLGSNSLDSGMALFWDCLKSHSNAKIAELATIISNRLEAHFLDYPDQYQEDLLTILLRRVKWHEFADYYVGAVGNHFGHTTRRMVGVLPTECRTPSQQIHNFIIAAAHKLAKDPNTTQALLDTIPLKLVSHQKLMTDLVELVGNTAQLAQPTLLQLLRNPQAGALELFTRLCERSDSYYLPIQAILDNKVPTDNVKELLARLRADCCHATPKLQTIWNIRKFEDYADIPGFIPMQQDGVPIEFGENYSKYQLTREQILELTQAGRLINVIPATTTTDIRAQLPGYSKAGVITIPTPTGEHELDWVLLNCEQTIDRKPILGWVTSPFDVGQGLLTAIVRAVGDFTATTPSANLYPDECQSVLPAENERYLFMDAYKAARPVLTAKSDEYVCFETRSMPLLGVLDGEPIVFVQVRPAVL